MQPAPEDHVCPPIYEVPPPIEDGILLFCAGGLFGIFVVMGVIVAFGDAAAVSAACVPCAIPLQI
jgi:hypothetical protein